jgi:hypothetical protein
MIKILKEKRGIPTVVEYMGNKYSLVHPDNKKGQIKTSKEKPRKEISETRR